MPDQFSAALLILRVVLGIVFIVHGVKHFINREKTERWTASMGFGRPTVQWFFMTFVEIGVGAAMVLGLLTSVASAGVVALMVVAYWTVHRAAGFFVSARPDEGYEYVLMLIAVAVVLAVMGPGEWSLDDALSIAGDLDGWLGAIIAGLGVPAAIGQLAMFYRPNSVSN